MNHWLKYIFTFNLILLFGISAIAKTVLLVSQPDHKRIASFSSNKVRHHLNHDTNDFNKNSQNDPSSQHEPSEDDADLESDEDMLLSSHSWLHLLVFKSSFNLNNYHFYNPPDLSLNTPPPKI
jgi:hypothetical protein